MNSFKVAPVRRPAYIVAGICLLSGILLLLGPVLGQSRFVALTELLSVALIAAALIVTNRYLLTSYLYEIEAVPSALSSAPKLNIYASRAHNSAHHFYCIPLDKCYTIERLARKEKPASFGTHPVVNCCGSMFPRQVYFLTYDCDGEPNGVYLECGDDFARALDEEIAAHGRRAPIPSDGGL